jgi:serine/threonine protein kinase
MLRVMSDELGPPDALGLVGTTIDQVRFDACVDAGGFGLIYRGYHEGLGETVAIKCLRIAAIQKTNEEIREALAGRFRDETKLLYRLSQGCLDIVRCISSGTVIAPTTKEYTPYMVLEWLDGCTLSVELKERRAQKLRPRTLDAAVALLDTAAVGLAYAHANDVVHRDVKPGNLFLARTRQGVRMKVLDFGLAKILSDESIGVRPSVETGVGVHFCSPSYGAPEQYSAQIGKVGPWTDVYSLTLVLLEVMTGDKVRPAGTLAEGLLKAIDKKTGSPTGKGLGLMLPQKVEELLARAVAQNPNDRPRDAGVFWGELKDAIATSPKPNLGMATVMDDSMNDAMKDVRDAAVKAASLAPPAPFTGTMIMQNAPQGAPHLVSAVPPVGAPLPAAGRPPEPAAGPSSSSGGTQPTAPPLARGTAPMQAVPGRDMSKPGSVPPPPGPDSVVEARRRGEQLKGTLPIGAISPFSGMSPLAESMAVVSPLRGGSATPPAFSGQQQQGQQGTQLMQAQPMQQPQSSVAPQPQQPQPSIQPAHPGSGAPPPSRNAPTDPRGTSVRPAGVPAKTGPGGIVFIVVCLALALTGIAYYFLKLRGP